MLIKIVAVAAVVGSAALAVPYVLPVPGAGEVRIEVTALRAFTPDSGTITGAETAKAWGHATAKTGAATGRVTTWTVTKTKTTSTVNGLAGKAAVGYVCNMHVTTPPYADRVTCANP
jgi:carbohydrate-binding DOMON domain-containing protein